MAPFKSQAQRAKLGEMVKEGTMTQEEFNKWNADTPHDKKLPERIHPKKPTGLDRIRKAKVR